MRKLVAVLTALVAAMAVGTATMVGSASATNQRIKPNQHYIGLVNDTHTNAVIYVICPGPADGTRTGPPAGNQTVSVKRVASGGGYTGSLAHGIWAQFNKDSSNVVGFSTYRTPQQIPPSLQLPCSGTGTVTFTTCFGTLPCAADAKDDVVPVTFVNLAV